MKRNIIKQDDIVFNERGLFFKILSTPQNSLTETIGLVHMRCVEIDTKTGEVLREDSTTGYNRLHGFCKFEVPKPKIPFLKIFLNYFKQKSAK